MSESEVPAEAVPGFGVGNSTVERDQNKRSRIAALSSGVVRLKRPIGQGRPHTLLDWDGYVKAASRHQNVGQFPL
jgi:hypothetical protein